MQRRVGLCVGVRAALASLGGSSLRGLIMQRSAWGQRQDPGQVRAQPLQTALRLHSVDME